MISDIFSVRHPRDATDDLTEDCVVDVTVLDLFRRCLTGSQFVAGQGIIRGRRAFAGKRTANNAFKVSFKPEAWLSKARRGMPFN